MVYGGFSLVYDKFMENTPYSAWVRYIEKIWDKFNIKPTIVLDLACGTGNITRRLAKKGYDMIGVDLSSDMLTQAREKTTKNLNILYLQQDMRELELFGTVDACICMVDGMNYILEENELLEVFKLVHNYLNPGGVFLFDMNTINKFENILGDKSFCETTEDAAFIWENYYDEKECINEYCVNIFVREKSGLYSRYEEIHYQKGYNPETIEALLAKAGFSLEGTFDELSLNCYNEKSEKIFFAARKQL